MIYIANSFSLGMLKHPNAMLRVRGINASEVKALLKENAFISSVGHESTAQIITKLTGIYVPFQRNSIYLGAGDKVIVFQLRLRLPEKKLLSEFELQEIIDKGLYSWKLVEVLEVEG